MSHNRSDIKSVTRDFKSLNIALERDLNYIDFEYSFFFLLHIKTSIGYSFNKIRHYETSVCLPYELNFQLIIVHIHVHVQLNLTGEESVHVSF